LLRKGMTPATVLRGPRRVGKTILLRQLIHRLLTDGVEPERILYVPFDDLPTMRGIKEPVLAISRWFEKQILGVSFNTATQRDKPAFLLLDEVQNLDSWAEQIKHLVDNHSLRVLITGSSSLRIEQGRDSLAGRITTLELGPLLLREIAGLRFGFHHSPLWPNGATEVLAQPQYWLDIKASLASTNEIRRSAFREFSQRGAYPIAQEQTETPWPELADYLNETVVRRAIQHDLRSGPKGQKRDEKLLEEVFRLACRYAGQIPGPSVFVPEIKQTLAGNIGWNRILTYLRFLDKTLLIRMIPPAELRLKRKKSPSKICLCDHALRASWLQEIIPLDPAGLDAQPHLADLAGHLAESALGYYLASIPSLDVAHFPVRGAEPEVDFLLTLGSRRVPIEVKYRKRIDAHQDTLGLRAFLEKSVYNAPLALLITLNDQVQVNDPRIVSLSLSEFLWLR